MRLPVQKSQQKKHIRTSKTGKVYEAGKGSIVEMPGEWGVHKYEDVLVEALNKVLPSAKLEDYIEKESAVGIKSSSIIVKVNEKDFDKYREGKELKISRNSKLKMDPIKFKLYEKIDEADENGKTNYFLDFDVE